MRDYYDKVKRILVMMPSTRDDDMLLYAVFCEWYSIVGRDEPFFHVMKTAKQRGLPSYEGVTRARRKVQELEPYLCGNRKKARKQEEAEYHRWYSEH